MRNIIASSIMGISTGVIAALFDFEIFNWQFWMIFCVIVATYWMGRYVQAKDN